MNKDCGETTNRTVDPLCDWVADPSCGSFLENGSAGPGVWARSQFDLSPFASRRSRLRWIFEGGGGWSFGESRSLLEPAFGGSALYSYDQDDGWYVDDIRLTDIQEGPPNSAPVADAGPDQSAVCTDLSGATVMLDGSGSSDPDGDDLVYQWSGSFSEGDGTVSGVGPTVTLPVGTSTISLIVSDCAESSRDSLEVTVGLQVDGFDQPLAGLVPEGDPVPLPGVAFVQGGVLPLRLQIFCGEDPLTDQEVDPPEIVALNRVGEPPIDLDVIDPSPGPSADDGFLFSSTGGGLWTFNLSTVDLTTGTWEITILMPDGTRHVGGFVLK